MNSHIARACDCGIHSLYTCTGRHLAGSPEGRPIPCLRSPQCSAVIPCASSRRSGRVPFSMTSDRIRRLHSVPVAIRVKTENEPSFKQIRGAFPMYRFDQWKTKHENNCEVLKVSTQSDRYMHTSISIPPEWCARFHRAGLRTNR